MVSSDTLRPSPLDQLVAQGYRDSWDLYRRLLEAPRGVWPQWDWICLTASDERQAEAYRIQIDWRRKSGLLPRAVNFLVVADPQGTRIGSGGATLNAAAEVARRLAALSREGPSGDPSRLFAWKRVLILHSGGEARRLPHCSAFGKIFARVPRELPDGRPSTLFDEFLVSLCGVPFRMAEGVFVASGDVMLLFDHRQIDLARQGVVGIAARAAADVGTRHGVYLSDDNGGRVRRFLHKSSLERLQAAGAVDEDGNVPIDTGMVWFDPTVTGQLLDLFGMAEDCTYPPGSRFHTLLVEEAPLNLYSDLLMPMAAETEFEDYRADESDGPRAPAVREMRPAIWERLHDRQFQVQALHPVEFIHFGTTAEYLDVVTDQGGWRRAIGWHSSVSSFESDSDLPATVVRIGSCVDAPLRFGRRAVIEDSHLEDEIAHTEDALISHVRSRQPIAIAPGTAIHQMPVANPISEKERGIVTLLYGVRDNPKRLFDQPGATFLNRPWEEWLGLAGLSEREVWEASAPEKSLWHARLFPFAPDPNDSLQLALWLQQETPVCSLRDRWLAAPRVSMAQAAQMADVRQVVENLRSLDDHIRARQFCARVVRRQPSADLAPLLGSKPEDVRRRAALVEHLLMQPGDDLLAMQGFKVLADALARHAEDPDSIELAYRNEDRAFGFLAHAIRRATLSHTPGRTGGGSVEMQKAVARAPARIDLAGGWSDTPPFSIECGGVVLNAAIRLRGSAPIRASVHCIDRPVLVLESDDHKVRREYTAVEEILRYSDPSDPLALQKAALVLTGLVTPPAAPGDSLAAQLERTVGGCGLHLVTEVALPHGSGLGTSSILAAALLAAIRRIQGRSLAFGEIFDEVLCLEQMLTTGGGWQDQIGGAVGGIKLAATEPGLPQVPRIEPVKMSPETAAELQQRLVVIYTGRRRLAKGLLRAIMGKFISRDPEIVRILKYIREIARAQRAALENGDIDQLGELMAEHWELNKRLDPGTTSPLFDQLFEAFEPFMKGAKLAGAGGGGFMELIANDADAVSALDATLKENFAGTGVAIWPSEIDPEGLVLEE